MKKNEFRIDITEDKMKQMLEYLNEIQEGVDRNRNTDNAYAFMSAMHYRDGFIRALTILGIDYDYSEAKIEGINHATFTRIKKDIYKD